MTWTYTTRPGVVDLDTVRFLIGDTNESDKILEDEELNYLLSEESTPLLAAYSACLAIVARFARLYDQSVGSVSYSLSQKIEHYNKLAKELKVKSEIRSSVPYCGGISVSDKQGNEGDEDWIDPSFDRNLHNDETNVRDREETRTWR